MEDSTVGDITFFIDDRVDLYIPHYECEDRILLDGVKVEVNKTSSKNIITIDVGRDCYYFLYCIAEHCEVKVSSSQIGKVFRTESGLCGVFILLDLDELRGRKIAVEIEYSDTCGEDVIYYIDEGIVETYHKSDLEPIKEVFYFSVP